MTKIKNILLIGISGSGMSTLGNVLVNKNSNFEEVFKTGDGSVSITTEIQTAEFEENGIKYRVIDTPGLESTALIPRQLSQKMVEAFQKPGEQGINQILFVFKSARFSEQQIKLYNYLKLIEENIGQHITMVGTDFYHFKDEAECQGNYENSKDENKVRKEIASIFKEINNLIMVDNSSISKERKEKSRKKLINHLEKNRRDDFHPTNLQEDYFLSEEEKKVIKELKEVLRKEKELKAAAIAEEDRARARNNRIKGFVVFLIIIFAIAISIYSLFRRRKKLEKFKNYFDCKN